MSNLKKIIATRLKFAREEADLTQAELAKHLGVARNTYTQIETGKNALSIEHLVKLPDTLHRPVNYFLGMGTEAFTAEEIELVELYRSISHPILRKNVLVYLRGTSKQARKESTPD